MEGSFTLDPAGDWLSYETATANVVNGCNTVQPIDKMTRNSAMFGLYNVTMGLRVYNSETATTFTTLGEWDF